jgi:hypothetical protein
LEAVRNILAHPQSRDELYFHTFVFSKHRLLYVETPRVASTSVKVALLTLTHTTIEDLGPSLLPRPFPEAVVHDRGVYPAPSLADLDDDELAEAIIAPGWMRFCLVRDPFSRTFSAWEGKVFVGDPGMLDRFQPLGSGDRLDGEYLDIRASVRAFIEDMAKRRDFYFEDMHFRPQIRVVRAGEIPYTNVVPLREIDNFLPTMQAHLQQMDPAAQLLMPRLYEGLGIPWQHNYDARAIELVADLYAEDIARFGFPIPAPIEGQGTRLDPIARNLLNNDRGSTRQLAAVHQALLSNSPITQP